MLLSIKPRVLLALSVILSVWMFHDRPLEMSTPSGEELGGVCGVWWVGWDGVLWRGVGWGGVGWGGVGLDSILSQDLGTSLNLV